MSFRSSSPSSSTPIFLPSFTSYSLHYSTFSCHASGILQSSPVTSFKTSFPPSLGFISRFLVSIHTFSHSIKIFKIQKLESTYERGNAAFICSSNFIISFLFMAEQNSIVYMYYIFIIYLFVDRRECATISVVESILESKSHLILHCFSMFQLKIYVRPKNFLVETMFSLVSFFLIKKSFCFFVQYILIMISTSPTPLSFSPSPPTQIYTLNFSLKCGLFAQ